MTAVPKRPKPLRDPAYLKAVAEMPCVLTGTAACEPAHIRYEFFGAGIKPDDNLVLPLRPDMHRLQHQVGEVSFWMAHVTPWLLMRALKALAREYYREWKEINKNDL